jgi:hypothetical protein
MRNSTVDAGDVESAVIATDRLLPCFPVFVLPPLSPSPLMPPSCHLQGAHLGSVLLVLASSGARSAPRALGAARLDLAPVFTLHNVLPHPSINPVRMQLA